MSDKLGERLEKLDYDNLNIIQLSDQLDGAYDLTEINQTVIQIRKKKEGTPRNTFGKCGIDPDANPCGDACDY